MKNDGYSLYFVAIILPEPFRGEAQKLKEYFHSDYQSKASLNSPPHITLHMPFRWKEKNENRIFESLENFSKQFSKIEIQLKNFGCFEPRVIFIEVIKNNQLQLLQQKLTKTFKSELNIFNSNYKDNHYNPHVTLAFRDLKKENFNKAWEEFKSREFNASFKIDSITLLKHDGSVWKIFREFSLNE